MSNRHQRGYVYKASGAWHVRYYDTDGRQKSHRLCNGVKPKSDAKRAAEDFLRDLNSKAALHDESTVAGFWETTYLPFIKENLKASTVEAYQQLWRNHLKDHFADTKLREYRKGQATQFLTTVSKTHAAYTVQGIRSLASGIFSHAASIDLVDANPIKFAKVLGRTLPRAEGKFYSLEEIENVITALVDHVDCQLIMALAFFLGLRKGEIAGLQWGDVDNDFIHIRRSVYRGIEGTPKTKKSIRSLPIIQPVRGLLVLWRKKAGDGVWVFSTKEGGPRNLQATANRVIRPALTKNKLEWKGFHAGRRGLGTTLRKLTGNSTAGRDVLGHEDEQMTKDHYEGKLPEIALAGLKLLEEKVVEQK
ncbi:MAG: tyrosine-type recombinase/integrase [Candidatus Sulfotelmatobacter sp.]